MLLANYYAAFYLASLICASLRRSARFSSAKRFNSATISRGRNFFGAGRLIATGFCRRDSNETILLRIQWPMLPIQLLLPYSCNDALRGSGVKSAGASLAGSISQGGFASSAADAIAEIPRSLGAPRCSISIGQLHWMLSISVISNCLINGIGGVSVEIVSTLTTDLADGARLAGLLFTVFFATLAGNCDFDLADFLDLASFGFGLAFEARAVFLDVAVRLCFVTSGSWAGTGDAIKAALPLSEIVRAKGSKPCSIICVDEICGGTDAPENWVSEITLRAIHNSPPENVLGPLSMM